MDLDSFENDSSAGIVSSSGEVSMLKKDSNASEAIDADLIRAILSKLTPSAFETFVTKLFHPDEGGYDQTPRDLNDSVFYQPLINSYGGSLHSVFLLQHLPLGLFNQPNLSKLSSDPTLALRLRRLKEIYNGKSGYFGMVSPELVKATQLRSLGFLINISGLPLRQYYDDIFPQYERLVRKIGLHTPTTLVGSYDSFMDFRADEVRKTLKDFLTNKTDGFVIQIRSDQSRAFYFTEQTSFESGVLEGNGCPYEPIFAAVSEKNAELVKEFEDLIRKDCSESEREKFLLAHATDIFGGKYDRIESQILLQFPQFDIAGKKRRLDLFMRNSISADWELFEIKNLIGLIRNYRNLPTMVTEVSHAITQLKNYSRLLSSPKIKETLKQLGIEYCEPTLNLVIGGKPQISSEQWNWLKAAQDKEVNIFTYDDLVSEMKIRLADRLRIFESFKKLSPSA